ncbi:MAG: hypothetical protein QNJ46_21660 [Leptolyngbyaceae cyanobacterium MO_188.B28]|nr:hypothetical protein [Leptolyngbyaceae cyanobacterium MO_188.B28]
MIEERWRSLLKDGSKLTGFPSNGTGKHTADYGQVVSQKDAFTIYGMLSAIIFIGVKAAWLP